MKQLGLICFAVCLLTLEGALGHLLRLEILRPDPVLPLVVFLALRPGVSGAVTTFGLGLIADSFSGTPLGMSAVIYLVVWGLVRLASAFLLPDRKLVQYGLLFAMSLVFYLALMGMLAGVLTGAGSVLRPVTTLAVWALPLALVNLLLAVPIWALTRRILGTPQRSGLFAPR